MATVYKRRELRPIPEGAAIITYRGKRYAQWVNTKTGAVDHSETFDHEGGQKQITSPDFVVDIALSIVRH